MNLREAYEALGLEPAVRFSERVSGHDRTGATTWMAVEAALAVMDGRRVVVVSRSLTEAERVARTCLGYIFKLTPGGGISRRPIGRGPSSRCYDLSGGGRLHWESEQTFRRFVAGRRDIEVFRDVDYQIMLTQRREGPFSEVRKLVRRADGSYAAYNARGEFLLDLTESGARQMLDADPYRIAVED